MKTNKFWGMLMLFMLAAFWAFSFSSCSSNDEVVDHKALIGRWHCTSMADYYDSNGQNIAHPLIIAEFAANKMRLHDPENAKNDVWINYTYKNPLMQIKINNEVYWTVEQVNSTTIKFIKILRQDKKFYVMTFKKAFANGELDYPIPSIGDPALKEPVDMGLSVKWASCNVGATTPEGYGDYFAWGEAIPQADNKYSWESYEWCNGSVTSLTKYCTKSDFGKVDNVICLDEKEDAAHTCMGRLWRMPTLEEQDELRDPKKCTWKWTTRKDVNGYEVTSLITGNSIFLPAAGYYYDNVLYHEGTDGFYWSSSLDTGYPLGAYEITFYSDRVYGFSNTRYCGMTVRAVYSNPH